MIEPVYQTIGGNIRQQRELSSMSLEELSTELARRGYSITKSGLSYIEQGKRRITAHAVLVFADALGTKPEALLAHRRRRRKAPGRRQR